jgi:integrase
LPRPRNAYGTTRKLASGRYQARFTGDDGLQHPAPMTFDSKGDAVMWLSTIRTDRARGLWKAPDKRSEQTLTFGVYSREWLDDRDLKPRTREHYKKLLSAQIGPTFDPTSIKSITPESVRRWHSLTAGATPTLRAHAYALLRTILNTAVADDLIPANPCRIRGAGTTKRARNIAPATLEQLAALVQAMPIRYRLMTLVAAWCGLRFGELVELRRKDVDLNNGVLHVRRGVVRSEGVTIIGTPKSEAGIRDVAIPPHLMPLVRKHMAEMTEANRDALLFPSRGGGSMNPSSLYKVFYPARQAAGRSDLRWHDLRHTGAVLAAATGATLAELMARLGHSTPAAALRYQHAAKGRDAEIANAMSALVGGKP